MASYRKRGRVWYFRYSDADGVKHEEKGCTDRRATEEIARKAESEAAKIRAGLIDPRDEAYRRHRARPLADHIADWHSYLTAKGSTRQHALLSRNRASRIIELARVERLSDLAPSKIQAALKAIRDTGISPRLFGTTFASPWRLFPAGPHARLPAQSPDLRPADPRSRDPAAQHRTARWGEMPHVRSSSLIGDLFRESAG